MVCLLALVGIAGCGPGTAAAVAVIVSAISGGGGGGDGKGSGDLLLFAAVYEDVNSNGRVDAPDTVRVTFAGDVTVVGSPAADGVFVLLPSGAFGTSSVVLTGSSQAEVVVANLGGATMQPNGLFGADAGSTGIRLIGGQNFILDGQGSPVVPRPSARDIGGTLHPRITAVTHVDANGSCTFDAGDMLEVTFTSDVTFASGDPMQAFQLPVTGDSLGTGATIAGGPVVKVAAATVIVGAGPVLQVAGVFDPSSLSPGSPSGLDLATSPGAVVHADFPQIRALPQPSPGVDLTAGITAPLPWTSTGDDERGAAFGSSVASAGDVNGDGFADVIVGSPMARGAGVRQGKAFLFLGGLCGLEATPSWTSLGDAVSRSQFGRSVASAGDVNRDGFDDVIVGATLSDDVAPDAGKAFVFLGGPTGLSLTPVWTSSGDGQGDSRYGASIACAGDVNGDTFDDIIIGSPRFDTLNQNAGKAYLYLGGPSGPSTLPDWQDVGNDLFAARFGFSVAGGGDVDGDGYDDVIAGAPFDSFDGTSTGRAFLYRGGLGGPAMTHDWSTSGDSLSDSYFGYAVAFAGDVNDDGYDDVLVGAPEFYDVSIVEDIGKAYLYHGGPSGPFSVPFWTSRGDDDLDSFFAISLSPAGDVNSDGFADIVVGASGYSVPFFAVGKAYVHLGGPGGMAAAPVWTSVGDPQNMARFGGSVAGAGDTNGDGRSDVIAGAASYRSTVAGEGKAYLFPEIP